MDQQKFNIQLTKQLSKLPSHRTVEFGLYACKKLYPDYVFFSTRNQWGDAGLLEQAINYCEANKYRKGLNIDETQRIADMVEAVTPDTEDFGDLDGSYALNTCVVVLCLLNFLIDGNISHAIDISTTVTDTIDFQLQEADNTLTDEQLNNHPLIAAEHEYHLKLTKTGDSFFNKVIQRIKGS